MKSMDTGLAFSSNSLSKINLKPFTSYELSVSLGSSRAIANEGPPQPPSFRKMRMGTMSRSLKYSAICWLAASEISTITSSLDMNMISFIRANKICLISKLSLIIITGAGFVNDESIVCYPAFIEAIADIFRRPLNPPVKKA